MEKKENRLSMVLYGALLGIVSNVLFTIPSLIRSSAYVGIFYMLITVFAVVYSIWGLRRAKGRRIRKARLCFFGISLTSFGFALVDVMVFVFGFHGIKLSWHDYPYLWFGDIPFISFLASLSTGGFFGVLERFLELHEKKDL